jgi:hypothetical protein
VNAPAIPGTEQPARRGPRILLGHLAAFGDCLCATTIARQIREDYPDCHLTWAIGSSFRGAVEENPHVDEIWEVPLHSRREIPAAWRSFVAEAKARKRRGDFDTMILTQVTPDNYRNFDGTVRPSIFRGYGRPITVPLQPVLRLRDDEVERVRVFAEAHRLSAYRHVILFEYAARSGQSTITPVYAQSVATRVLAALRESVIILTAGEPLRSTNPRMIDGSSLRFRDNAELTKYCTLFVGCSSGITWLSTSDWARRLPTIQVLNATTSVFASLVHDAAYFHLPSDHIIEMTSCPEDHLARCIVDACTRDFAGVRREFHEEIPVDLSFYWERFMLSVLKTGDVLSVLRSLRHVLRRYGAAPFRRYARHIFDSL